MRDVGVACGWRQTQAAVGEGRAGQGIAITQPRYGADWDFCLKPSGVGLSSESSAGKGPA